MKPAVKMSRRVDILLAEARSEVLERVGAMDATPANLVILASEIKQAIIRQVLEGGWVELGIASDEPEKLLSLGVTAHLGRGLHEPGVIMEFDFSKTAFPLLKISCRKPN